MPNSARMLKKDLQPIKRLVFISLLTVAIFPAYAVALEYRSVATPKAVLYDAPSSQGRKLYVVGQGYPVEVIVNLGDWLKVRDAQGSLTWVEAKDLANKRTLLVTAQQAEVRQTPDSAAKLIYRLQKDVVLEMLEPANSDSAGKNWIKVRHRDGLTGYVLATSVWGY